ncbi:MAG: hypothetical protein GC184_01965 [Rhizobiales bacterium]|nr:hypothetical protein [Hyphomicrobiales bacterium]
MIDAAGLFFLMAAFISLLGLLAHEFLGAPLVLPPLEKAQLPANIIWLHHFSWHVGSIAIAALMALYIYPAFVPGNQAMAVIATAISLSFTLLGVTLAIWGNAALWKTPAPYIWAIVTIIGGTGLLV